MSRVGSAEAPAAISSLVLSSDGAVLVGGTSDGRVVAWTRRSGKAATIGDRREGEGEGEEGGEGQGSASGWELTGSYIACRPSSGAAGEPPLRPARLIGDPLS